MSVLYLTEADVQRLLPMRDCIGLMQTAFERLASGEAINQPRRRLHLPTRSTMHYMAASDGPNFGIKVYSTNPKYGARFLFLLYRSEDAALLAVLEANHLGQIRTGAASGLATSLLANPDAHTLGIIGSGFHEVIGAASVPIYSIFVLLSSIFMLNRKAYGLAMAGSIAAIIPCFCCFVGVPFGIWSLIVLNDPSVREAFS